MYPLTRSTSRARFFGAAPSLLLDFLSGSLDSRITFTRASTATFFDSAGVLTSASNDVARFDYNPATLAPLGLLIEESRTNGIRNNTMVGAAAGTPGTLPTNWSVGGLGTLTQQVVGTGTANGITYIDVRFSGTTSTTQLLIRFDSIGTIAASNGQSWAISAWLAVVGGSTANTNTYTLGNNLFDSGGVYIGEGPSITLASPPTSTFTRYSGAGTIATVNTASTRPYFYALFASGVAVDFTIRIGLPQLEQGAFATSVIPTTTTALTRAADVASVNTLSPWFNAVEGTLFAEFLPGNLSANATAVEFGDGTLNNRFNIEPQPGTNLRTWARVAVSGALQIDIPINNTLSLTVPTKSALAVQANNMNLAANGVAGTTDTSCTVPTVNKMQIGNINTGSGSALNGYLRRITYYPRRLPDSALQSLTL
jgi:hypothetical protein